MRLFILLTALLALGCPAPISLDTIQEQIDDACADGGGTVIIPQGTHISTTWIIPCEGITLDGKSMRNRVSIETGITGIFSDQNYTQIKNMDLRHDGNDARNVGIHFARDDAWGPALWVIDRVRFVTSVDSPNGLGNGLLLDGTGKGMLSNSFFWNWTNGVMAINEPNANVLIANTLSNNDVGVYVSGLNSHFDLVSNTFESNVIGVLGEEGDGAGIMNLYGNHQENEGEAHIKRGARGPGFNVNGDRMGGNTEFDFIKTVSGASKDVLTNVYFKKGIKNTTGDCVRVIHPINKAGGANMNPGEVCLEEF